jgi:N-ethylmaleimide reductase
MLFEPFSIAPLGQLKSRIAMAAMTRGFAGPEHLASDQMKEYYARRAEDGVGFILTEGVIISPEGDGYKEIPRLCTDAQTESWKKVTAAVHAHGTKFFCQIWHCGRVSHEDFTDGIPPVSSSPSQLEGINRQNNKPYAVPRPLETNEMPRVYADFAAAAKRAIAAGFDGVQIHMAHGYLVDNFLDGSINQRNDQYGGSVANRCRFAIELLEEVIAAVGADKVMVRLSPMRETPNHHEWPDWAAMMDHLLPAFEKAGLRMIDLSCARADYFKTAGVVIRHIRPKWKHFLMGGASLNQEQAEGELKAGLLDMITWGRPILANPDFVSLLKAGKTPVPFDPAMLGSLR